MKNKNFDEKILTAQKPRDVGFDKEMEIAREIISRNKNLMKMFAES